MDFVLLDIHGGKFCEDAWILCGKLCKYSQKCGGVCSVVVFAMVCLFLVHIHRWCTKHQNNYPKKWQLGDL